MSILLFSLVIIFTQYNGWPHAFVYLSSISRIFLEIKNADIIDIVGSLIVSWEFYNTLHLRSYSLYSGFALFSLKSCRKLLGTWNFSVNIDSINPKGIKRHCYQTCVDYSCVEIQKDIISTSV